MPCGTTGENPTLTARRAHSHRRDPGGRGDRQGAGARRCRRLQHARGHSLRGRDAARPAPAACSRSPRTTTSRHRKGCFRTISAIAESTPLPIVVYNVPGRTGVNIEPSTAGAACRDSEHRRRQGSLGQHQRRCATICRVVPSDFIVLSGDDALTLPLMAIGGRGVISVASNEIPAEMVADGRSGRARRLRGRARDA